MAAEDPGAKFKTYLGVNGVITAIDILNPGSGYISAPVLEINGSNPDGKDARISAVIGHETVRSFTTHVKFDRISSSYIITKLDETENFIGTGSKLHLRIKMAYRFKTKQYYNYCRRYRVISKRIYISKQS